MESSSSTSGSSLPTSTGAYESLLRTIAELQGDLSLAVSTATQQRQECGLLRAQCERMRGELLTLKASYDEVRRALLTESEARIGVERAHEALCAQWRSQLEARERELEAVHTALAPPRDLEALKAQLAEELATPYRAKIASLEAEVAALRGDNSSLARQLEALRVEHAAFAADQSAEAEATHEAHKVATAALHRNIAALQLQLDTAARESGAKIRALRTQVAEASGRATAAAAEAADLRASLDDALKRADEAVKAAQRKDTEAAAARYAVESDAAASRRRATAADDHASQLALVHAEASARAAGLATEVTTLSAQLTAMTRQHDAAVAAAQRQREEVEAETRSALAVCHTTLGQVKEQLAVETSRRQAAEAIVAEATRSRRLRGTAATLQLMEGAASLRRPLADATLGGGGAASFLSGDDGGEDALLAQHEAEIASLRRALAAERERWAGVAPALATMQAALRRLQRRFLGGTPGSAAHAATGSEGGGRPGSDAARSQRRRSSGEGGEAGAAVASAGPGLWRSVGGPLGATAASPSLGASASGLGWGAALASHTHGTAAFATRSGGGGGGVAGGLPPSGSARATAGTAAIHGDGDASSGEAGESLVVADASALADALQREAAAVASEVSQLRADSDAMRGQWSTMQRAIAELQAEQATQRSITARAEAAETALTQLRGEYAHVAEACDKARVDNALYRRALQDLTGKASRDLEHAQQVWRQRLAQSEGRRDRYKAALDAATRKCERYKRSVLQLHQLYRAVRDGSAGAEVLRRSYEAGGGDGDARFVSDDEGGDGAGRARGSDVENARPTVSGGKPAAAAGGGGGVSRLVATRIADDMAMRAADARHRGGDRGHGAGAAASGGSA